MKRASALKEFENVVGSLGRKGAGREDKGYVEEIFGTKIIKKGKRKGQTAVWGKRVYKNRTFFVGSRWGEPKTMEDIDDNYYLPFFLDTHLDAKRVFTDMVNDEVSLT